MKYLIETKQGVIEDLDMFSICKMLKQCRLQHTFQTVDIESAGEEQFREFIPVGSIPFVGRWLENNHGILTMNPIEVPEPLREDRFLGRQYTIVKGEDIPKTGNHFVKDVSTLKTMGFSGDVASLHKCSMIKPDGLYQVSTLVDIVSEYRVFVDDMEIEAICLYNGDCKVFPDVKLLQEMIFRYKAHGVPPNSYTMDVAVIKEGQTVLLEIHPITSVGLYGYVSRNLAYMYKDGIDYYINNNLALEADI